MKIKTVITPIGKLEYMKKKSLLSKILFSLR